MKLRRHFRHVVERIRERRAKAGSVFIMDLESLSARGHWPTIRADYQQLEQRAARQAAKVERFSLGLIARACTPELLEKAVCQFDPECLKPVTTRVQLGIYAGSWRVCDDHVEPLRARGKAQKLKVYVSPLAERFDR